MDILEKVVAYKQQEVELRKTMTSPKELESYALFKKETKSVSESLTKNNWQPIVGLLGVILFTIFSVWIGARIFRTAILIQGQKPSFNNLVKYAFKK